MMDWDAVIPKLIAILKERTNEIRRDGLLPDEIVRSATADILASGVATTTLELGDFPEGVQMRMLETLLHRINENNRKNVRNFLESLGEVSEDTTHNGDSFLEEDEEHVFILFERMRVKLKKDLILKIVSLGYAPAS